MESHQATTGLTAQTVVADSKYGPIDNFLACYDRGIEAHIPELRETALKRTTKGIFSEDRFQYDPHHDSYRCPAGKILKPKSLHLNRQSRDYGAPKKVCTACTFREQCTRNKSGRTIKRHLRQEELEHMRKASRSAKAKRDLKTRRHLMERSFAQSKRYGYDRARWRGLWRMRIQEYLTCAIQNIQVLLKYRRKPTKSVALALTLAKEALTKARVWAAVLMSNLMQRLRRTFGVTMMSSVSLEG